MRLPALLLAAALSGTVGLTLGPVPVALAQEAPAPAPLTFEVADLVITAGGSTTGAGTAGPGETVELLGSTRGSEVALVATTVADDAGAYSFALSPLVNTRYGVRTATQEGPGVLLRVRYAVLLDGVQQPAGDELVLTGTVMPGRAGTLVQIVFERDGVRTREASGRTTSQGRFQVRLTSERRGAFQVSAFVPGTLDNSTGESAQQRVVVVPAPVDPAPQQP